MTSTARSKWISDFLSALSLVNLCFLSVWRELLFADEADSYWLPNYTSETFVAILTNVFIGTGIVYAVLHYLVPSERPWLALCSRLFLVILIVFPLNYVRIALDVNESAIHWLKDFWWISGPAIGVLSLLGLYLLVFRLAPLVRAVVFLALALSPFALMNLAQVAWSLTRFAHAAPVATKSKTKPPLQKRQRVFWLLMDELDLRLVFQERPDGLVLPELDRFQSQAVFAHNTVSYSRSTKEAIPSFLLQKIVHHAWSTGAKNLELSFMEFEETPNGNFSKFPNFFTEAAAIGARIAILGYYHPYCRLFREEAEYCQDYAVNTYAPFATNDIFEEVWSQILGITPIFRRLNGVRTYVHAVEQAQHITADASFDLVFVHASVPHGPNIWDPETQDFTLLNTSKDGYFDNLILADRFLGTIRRSMEEAGLWDQTTVLITSDHEWRHTYLYDHRRVRQIPFMLKMPRQEKRLDFVSPIAPMRVTKDLLLGIMENKLQKPESVTEWLQHRSLTLSGQ